jgi:hypothetical protein
VGLWDGSVFSLIGGGVFSLQRENPLGEDENALYAIFGVKISATQFELHWGQNPTISLEPSSG